MDLCDTVVRADIHEDVAFPDGGELLVCFARFHISFHEIQRDDPRGRYFVVVCKLLAPERVRLGHLDIHVKSPSCVNGEDICVIFDEMPFELITAETLLSDQSDDCYLKFPVTHLPERVKISIIASRTMVSQQSQVVVG